MIREIIGSTLFPEMAESMKVEQHLAAVGNLQARINSCAMEPTLQMELKNLFGGQDKEGDEKK